MKLKVNGVALLLAVGLVLLTVALAVRSAPAASEDGPQQVLTSPGPLSAAHAKLEGAASCAKCHESGKAIKAEKCLGCHDKIAARIAAKKGVHRDVTGDCQDCHVEHQGVDVDLRPLEKDQFDHQEETGFPFEGKHAALAKDCGACHRTRSYLQVKPACDFCHRDPHQGAMRESCTACHTPAGWPNAARDFHKAGAFPLEGRHLTVPCASCHLNGVVKGTPRRCYDCHWIRRQDDPYRTRLGSECEDCHRPVSWLAVNWDHGARTGQALNGPHRTLNCDACHKDRTFKGASFDCYSCHREDYDETEDPNHRTAGFPTDCQLCHRPSDSSFHEARFNHAGIYPLQGVHAAQPCSACHKNGVYQGTPRECYGCHRANYEQTRDPNHVAAGFPTTCELCHKPSDPNWDAADFNHSLIFPLLGVHATQACGACHKNNVYQGTTRECYGCHRANYEQTRDPNHVAAGFPTTCELCHKPSDASWDRALFNHSTVYPLQGVHATQACSACHKNNVYRGTTRECYGCHRANYEQTRDPNHVAAGFPATCELCHKPSDPSWDRALFNHGTVYALQGVHATLACSACHKNNVYRGTTRECYGCHRADYEGANDPNHVAAGFPTTCEVCHRPSDSSFNQGRFDHTWFPINSGRHAGNACSACHIDANNFKVFSCLTCHTRSSTDAEHQGRAGYAYDSAACYSCHPQGRG